MTVDIEARARELVRDYVQHVFRFHGTAPPEDVFLQNAAAALAREVAEDCARIAEEQRQVFASEEYAVGQPASSFSERFACGSVAVAIRTRFNLKESDRG